MRRRPKVNVIAREAGVGLATVDRVLNERPGVHEKTVRAVQTAIARLGYVRDVAAANLARSRHNRLAFVLPDSGSQFLRTLVDTLVAASPLAATARTEILLFRFPDEDPHGLASLLGALPDQGVDGVAIMAPETPVLRDAIGALRARGVAVAALVSDLPNTARDHFIGIDNRAAGRTAGVLMGRFTRGGPGRILTLGRSMLLREALERRAGFDEVMQRDFPRLNVMQTLETHDRPDILRPVVTEAVRHAPDLAGIYILGAGHRALNATLSDLGLSRRVVVIGHELTPTARAALEAGTMDVVITQNVGHLVRSALRVLQGVVAHLRPEA